MATSRHTSYTTIATALSTELNSLANNTLSSASSSIDNSTDRHMFIDLELYIAAQSAARTTSAGVEVYMTQALDGTNFADNLRSTATLLVVFELDDATTARRVARADIPIVGLPFKLSVFNATGQAFASSGNTLKYRLHSIEHV